MKRYHRSGWDRYAGTAAEGFLLLSVVCPVASGAMVEWLVVIATSPSASASERNFSASRAAMQPEPMQRSH
jgi:hypothetical protein